MEISGMTDKQWKGWLRRLSREGELATTLHKKSITDQRWNVKKRIPRHKSGDY